MSSPKNIILPQWIAGIGGVFAFYIVTVCNFTLIQILLTLLMLQIGFMSGWPSPAIARLTSPQSEIPLTLEQASWVIALVNLSRFFGAVLGAVTTDYFGSKTAVLTTSVPIALSWLIIALANSAEWLYIARLCAGLGLGMCYSCFPLYIGEVSMPGIRGALMSMSAFGVPFGQLVASLLDSYFNLTTSSCIYLAFALVLMIMFVWLPESPHHLVKTRKYKDAKRSIQWYRSGVGVEQELDAVNVFVTSSSKVSFMDKLKEFRSSAIRNATLQVMALFSFTQICGVNGVLFYMEIILKDAGFNLIDPALVVVYVNISGTVACVVSIFLVDSYGRRFLLLLSSIGVTTSMVGLMIQFFLLDANENVEHLQWLPMISMFLFAIFYTIGLMTVPSTILSEIFPANVKCIAASIAGLTGAAMSFLSSKTYQPMLDAMGYSYVFLFFALCTFIVVPYTIFIMPETKGKSLQQIQNELIKK